MLDRFISGAYDDVSVRSEYLDAATGAYKAIVEISIPGNIIRCAQFGGDMDTLVRAVAGPINSAREAARLKQAYASRPKPKLRAGLRGYRR